MPEAPASASADPPAPPSRTTAPAVVLAFDFGRRRIGVACGDTVSRSAAPLGAVAAGGADGRAGRPSMRCCATWQPSLVVVGLPYNARRFRERHDGRGARLRRRARARASRLPVELVDERYSSLEARDAAAASARVGPAQAARGEGTTSTRRRACIILERWFSANNMRRTCVHRQDGAGGLRHLITLDGLCPRGADGDSRSRGELSPASGSARVRRARARRRDARQPVLRAEHAHPRLVRSRQPAAGRARPQPGSAVELARQGRDHAGHDLHARGDEHRHVRDPRFARPACRNS